MSIRVSDRAKETERTSLADQAHHALSRLGNILNYLQCLNDNIDGVGRDYDKSDPRQPAEPEPPALAPAIRQINELSSDIETVLVEIRKKLVGN